MKTFYKLKFIVLFLLVLCQFSALKTHATHAWGAELRYACLGGNQYELTYTFYRDCASTVPAPTNPAISYSSSCMAGGSVILSPLPSNPLYADITCPTALSTCNGGTYTGVEIYTYTGIVTLPGTCHDWIFSFGHCCRSNDITTVPNPGSYDLYVFALLNNSGGDCNSSPTFQSDPNYIIYVGQAAWISNAVDDPDGDSISYQLITPLDGLGTPIQYDPNYSATQPITSFPQVIFDQSTGIIRAQPNQFEVSVFSVLVSEYRNGVLVGQSQRDMQIEVSNSNNFAPSLYGMNGTPAISANICAGETFSFYINTTDGDSTQQTFLSWSQSVPGALFNTSGTMRDTGYFEWTPTLSQARSQPYCFDVAVSDDNCPYIGRSTRNFCITVRDSTHPACLTTGLPVIGNYPEVRLSRNELRHELDWNYAEDFSYVRLMDISGRELRRETLERQSNFTFDLDAYRAGIYFICLEGKERWCGKVIKE